MILVVEAGMTTLGDFKRKRHFRATPGGRGMGRKASGKKGGDLVVRVPPGTVVRDVASGDLIGDLVAPGQELDQVERLAVHDHPDPGEPERGHPAGDHGADRVVAPRAVPDADDQRHPAQRSSSTVRSRKCVAQEMQGS